MTSILHPRFVDVVNGERNAILVSIESKETDRNVTLKNIAGSLHNAQTNKLVKNVRNHSRVVSPVCSHVPCSSRRRTTPSPSLKVLPCSFLTRSTASERSLSCSLVDPWSHS